jgi:hypothetical protein
MPPIRSESRQKLANQEGKILLALDDLKNGRVKSLRAAAKLYEIPLTTLHARTDGRISRVDKRPSGHKLTQFEEDSLTEWIMSMDSRGAVPKPSTVREMANILLAARGITPPPNVTGKRAGHVSERATCPLFRVRTRPSVFNQPLCHQNALNPLEIQPIKRAGFY